MYKSYEDLFIQINRLLDKRIPGGAVMMPRHLLTNDARSESADLSKVISAVTGDLGTIIEARIISGLNVTAKSPPSVTVTVSSGTGTANGKLFTLDNDIDVKIPLDNTTYIYYIHLYNNALEIRRDKPSTHLVVAKIIVPNPGVTARIVDDKPSDGYDGWIVSGKDMFFDQDQEFDDDSREVIKNVFSEIAAEIIFGTLTASENLTITNVLGTMRLDSQAMTFQDGEGNELGYYGADYARVGNIKILPDRLLSGNYISESSGFLIRDNGFAEFEDVRIRGRLSSSVFEYDKISGVGGKILVGNASVLAVGVSLENSTITVEDSVFSVGEILTIRDGLNIEYMEVTSVANAPTYSVTRDLEGIGASTWGKGTAIISTGNGLSGSQTGFISLDAVSNSSPFIDVNYRNSTTYNDWSTRVRLGNLVGISDSDYGNLTGFGLYSDNVYLKGKLYAPDIRTAVTGSRIEIDADRLIAYDDSSNEIFKVLLSGADVGDVIMGDYANTKGTKWDKSASTFNIKGVITATSGDFTGTVNIGTAGKVYIDGANELIKVYDASNNLRVELGKFT